MIYASILNQDLTSLNETTEKLIEYIDLASDLIPNKSNIHKLEITMKDIENINIEYNQKLIEVKNIVESTHFNKLSDLVVASNNDELLETYNKTIDLTRQLHSKNKNLTSLFELCKKITDNHINLIIGKKQEPTNYNFDKNNLNKHMLNQFKKNR